MVDPESVEERLGRLTELLEEGERIRAAGMRNVLVHGYLEVDDEIVWKALGHPDDLRQFAAFAGSQLG